MRSSMADTGKNQPDSGTADLTLHKCQEELWESHSSLQVSFGKHLEDYYCFMWFDYTSICQLHRDSHCVISFMWCHHRQLIVCFVVGGANQDGRWDTSLVRSAVPVISYRDPGCQTAVRPPTKASGGALTTPAGPCLILAPVGAQSQLEHRVGPGRTGATSARETGPLWPLPDGATSADCAVAGEHDGAIHYTYATSTQTHLGGSVEALEVPATQEEPTRAELLAAIHGAGVALEGKIEMVAVEVNLLRADLRKVSDKFKVAEGSIVDLQTEVGTLCKQKAQVTSTVGTLEARLEDSEDRT
ncbi:hypothetical protein NDU88_004767 [Pleurodeles waltl]|uniref:Uncharacterized protein n=1 Tax=Pleurodeles waltl TaxID=8319 RepID=A0AAV7QJB3_PLEWA|nr:hypothetical protein NDU88_004767 [Pleurodeles waltl]